MSTTPPTRQTDPRSSHCSWSNESLNRWIKKQWTNEWMDRWMDEWNCGWTRFFFGLPLHWRPLRRGTSSPSYFFSEQLCRFFSDPAIRFLPNQLQLGAWKVCLVAEESKSNVVHRRRDTRRGVVWVSHRRVSRSSSSSRSSSCSCSCGCSCSCSCTCSCSCSCSCSWCCCCCCCWCCCCCCCCW